MARDTVRTEVEVQINPLIDGLNDLIRALEIYKQDIPRGLDAFTRAQEQFATSLEKASKAQRSAAGMLINQVKRDVNSVLREFDKLKVKAGLIAKELSDIAPKIGGEQAKELARELSIVEKQVKNIANDFSTVLPKALKENRQILTTQFTTDLRKISREFDNIVKKARQLAAENERAERAERRRLIETERIRARYQDRVSRIRTGEEFRKTAREISSVRRNVQALGREIEKEASRLDTLNKKMMAGARSLEQFEARVAARMKQQEKLYAIRGRELSLIAERMRTYPFQAHELARPAEQVITSMWIAGPRQTLKTWWAEAGKIAEKEGRRQAGVFIQSFGQFFKQNFARAFGAWLGAAITTFPIAYGVISTIGELNRQYNVLVDVSRYVQSATVGVAGTFADLSGIMKNIISLSVKTGKSFEEVGKALWEMKSAGFGMREALAGTEVALKLTMLAGGGIDIGKATRIVAGMYRLFKDQFAGIADETERFKNMFGEVVYVLNSSQIALDELLRSFEYFGATAKATGMPLEQMLGYLSVLSDERLPGVGRAARQAANQIAQAIPMIAARYGIVLDSSKSLASEMNKVFEALNARIKDGTLSLEEFSVWMKEAGVRGGPAIIALARNWDKVKRTIELLKDSQKSLAMDFDEFFETVAEIRMSTFEMQWNRLKNAIFGVTAEGIHPLKNEMADLFKIMADGFETLWKALDNTSLALDALLASAGAFIGARVGAATGAMFGGPLGAMIGGSLGLGAGIGLGKFQHWSEEQIQKQIIGFTYDDLSKAINNLFAPERFVPLIEDALSNVKKSMDTVDAAFGDDLIESSFSYDEASVKAAAERIARAFNAQFVLAISSSNLKDEISKKLSESFRIDPDVIANMIQSGATTEEIWKYINDRLLEAAEAAGVTEEQLRSLTTTLKEGYTETKRYADNLKYFAETLVLASTGKKGLENAAIGINENYKSLLVTLGRLSDKLYEIKQIEARIAAGESGDELARQWNELVAQANALSDSVVTYAKNIASKYSTISRGISEIENKYRSLAAIGNPFEGMLKAADDIERIRKTIAALNSEGTRFKEVGKKIEEALANVSDENIRKGLEALLDIYKKIGELSGKDFGGLKESIFDAELDKILKKLDTKIRSHVVALGEDLSGDIAQIYKDTVNAVLSGEGAEGTSAIDELEKQLKARRDEIVSKYGEEKYKKILDEIIDRKKKLIQLEEIRIGLAESKKIIEALKKEKEAVQSLGDVYKEVSDMVFELYVSSLPEKEQEYIKLVQKYNELSGRIVQERNKALEAGVDISIYDKAQELLDEWLKKQKEILEGQEKIKIGLAESKKIIETLKKEKEALQSLGDTYREVSELVFELYVSSLPEKEQEYIKLVRKYRELSGKIIQERNKALEAGIDTSAYDRAQELLDEWFNRQKEKLNEQYDIHKKTTEKIKNIWKGVPDSLENVIANWIRELKVDFDDVVEIVKDAAARSVAAWIMAWAQAQFMVPIPMAAPAYGGGQAGVQVGGASAGGGFVAPPGTWSAFNNGLQNYFTAPTRFMGWLTYSLPSGPWTKPLAYGTAWLYNNPWASAGIMSGFTTYLFTGDLKSAAFSGLGAGIGYALGGPVGGFLGGAAGSFLGGLFGKKKYPKVKYEAEFTVDFVPGSGFRLAEFDLTTTRKHGAKKEYEESVRKEIEQIINQPIDWLNQMYAEVIGDLPDNLRQRFDRELAQIKYSATLKERTHKSLKGDINTMQFQAYIRDLFLTYGQTFEEAFQEEMRLGVEKFEVVSPYLKENVRNWIVEQAQELFPDDVFEKLKEIPIENMGSKDFEKWLEENIKPLFDDISAWEEFYDWAMEYLSNVEEIVTSIEDGLKYFTSFGSKMRSLSIEFKELVSQMDEMGIDFSKLYDSYKNMVQQQFRLSLVQQFPELYSGDLYLETLMNNLAPVIDYLGIGYEQIWNLVKSGNYQAFTDILWNIGDNLEFLMQVSEETGISIEDLIGYLASLGDAAYQVNQQLAQLQYTAASSVFEWKGGSYELYVKRQRLSEIEAKYGISDREVEYLANMYYKYLTGDQQAKQFAEELIAAYGTEGERDALEAITIWTELQKNNMREASDYSSQIPDYMDKAKQKMIEALDLIDQKITDLKLGSLNVALPTEKLSVAEEEYRKLYKEALSGDSDALREYLSFSSQYLELYQSVYKSSEEYQKKFDQVMRDLEYLKQVYGSLPSYQTGGVVEASQLAILHGPEAVVPLVNGAIPVAISGGVSKEELVEAMKVAILSAANERPLMIKVYIGGEELTEHIIKLVDEYRVQAAARNVVADTVRVF